MVYYLYMHSTAHFAIFNALYLLLQLIKEQGSRLFHVKQNTCRRQAD